MWKLAILHANVMTFYVSVGIFSKTLERNTVGEKDKDANSNPQGD